MEARWIFNWEYSSQCLFVIQGDWYLFISIQKRLIWYTVSTFTIFIHWSGLQYQLYHFDYKLIFLPSLEHHRNHPCHKSSSVHCSFRSLWKCGDIKVLLLFIILLLPLAPATDATGRRGQCRQQEQESGKSAKAGLRIWARKVATQKNFILHENYNSFQNCEINLHMDFCSHWT